jgi:hypothetical protein
MIARDAMFEFGNVCFLGGSPGAHRDGGFYTPPPGRELLLSPTTSTATAKWLTASGELHRTLRPSLPGDYESHMLRMFGEGAKMAVLHVDRVWRGQIRREHVRLMPLPGCAALRPGYDEA